MQILEAQYEIVTPMFIAGANQQDDPEIRPPSVKGALRFWWRALQWDVCLNECNGDTGAALTKLHQQEAELFGAATKEGLYGQGKISLKIKSTTLKNNNFLPTINAGLTYLLGQGLYHFKNGLLKPALAPKQSFSVILKLDNGVNADSVINALLALGLLGGLGSRARKGWGSIAIRSLTHEEKDKSRKSIAVPEDIETYKQCILRLLNSPTNLLPPFSAFSKSTQIEISSIANNPLQALEQIGNEMQLYRSYGRNSGSGHEVNGKPAAQIFKDDHDVILDFAQGKTVKQHPKRLIFGLPHNYFYSNGTKVDVDAEKFSRRASPLLIHMHQFSSGQTIGLHCLLKSEFLPDGENIKLTNKKSKNTQLVTCAINWQVIDTYLNRFPQRQKII